MERRNGNSFRTLAQTVCLYTELNSVGECGHVCMPGLHGSATIERLWQ